MSESFDSFNQWVDDLSHQHLPRWNELPDIFLYKDQVVSLVDKYVSSYSIDETCITPAMINNYVKLGIIPKPDNKKRYERRHLAYLIAVTLLKQVVPLKLINQAIDLQANFDGERDAYDAFCEGIEEAVKACANSYLSHHYQEDYQFSDATFLIRYGCRAFANKLIAMRFVMLSQGGHKHE